MGLPQIVSRNVSQKIPQFSLNLRKVLSGGTDGDFYTVPASKKAIIQGRAVCTGLGAAATVELEVAGVSIQQWNAGGGTEVNADPKIINIYMDFVVELDATEVLRYTQNSGTNAEMNVFLRIQESAA